MSRLHFNSSSELLDEAKKEINHSPAFSLPSAPRDFHHRGGWEQLDEFLLLGDTLIYHSHVLHTVVETYYVPSIELGTRSQCSAFLVDMQGNGHL